jgi:hypothetical protein
MEPSPPGASHATRTGTFHVTRGGGPDYVSAGHHLILWAVFFAPGGVAFCQGSLSQPAEDGCVNLAATVARFYRQHLPVAAEVVVFLS